jgi:hypothetical protein
MSDQCRACTVRGNAEECRNQDCSTHDSWFPQYLKEQLEIAEKVKEVLEHQLKTICCRSENHCITRGIISRTCDEYCIKEAEKAVKESEGDNDK